MDDLHIRPIGSLDCSALADLLNAIIERGGTTARVIPVTRQDMVDALLIAPDQSAWHLAENASGEILGFQSIKPNAALPPDACDIATFTRVGKTGLGIGSLLFAATSAAARRLGYDWINANIRAENELGLAYYQSRGFEPYTRLTSVPLDNGQLVDKIVMRFDLH